MGEGVSRPDPELDVVRYPGKPWLQGLALDLPTVSTVSHRQPHCVDAGLRGESHCGVIGLPITARVMGHLARQFNGRQQPFAICLQLRNTVSPAGCGGILMAMALTGPLVTTLPPCAVPLGMTISVPALNSLRSPPSHIAPLPSMMY